MIYPGQTIDTRYQIIKEIGEGGAGVVYLAYHIKLEKYVVIKRLKSTNSPNVRQEVDILKNLHHKYLPQVYDYLEMDGDVYTVIDFIEGYDLSRYVKEGIAVQEDLIIKWLLQLTEVLEYLHSSSNNIIHGDIKPSNIMLNAAGDVCLIDFNISMDKNSFTLSGITPAYAAPEQISLAQAIEHRLDETYGSSRSYGSEIELGTLGVNIEAYIDKRADIYSLGACFYHLMTGIRPYIGVLDDNAFGGTDIYRKTLVDIVRKAMNPDREKRYQSAAEMHKAVLRASDEYKTKLKIRGLIIAAVGIIAVSTVAGVISYRNNKKEQELREYSSTYNRMVDEFNSGDFTSTDFRLRLIDTYLNDETGKHFLDDNPDKEAEVNYMLGYTYYKEADYAKAIEYYNMARAEDDTNPDIFRELAICYARQGSLADAQYYLTMASERGMEESDVIYTQAEIDFESGDIYSASEGLTKLSQMNIPDNMKVRAAYLMSDVSHEMQSYSELIESYGDISIGKDSESYLYRLLMNACLTESGINEEEKVHFLVLGEDYGKKLMNTGLMSNDDRFILASIYIELGQFADARLTLTDIYDAESDYRVQAWLAYVYRKEAEAENSSMEEAYQYADKARATESYKQAVAAGTVDPNVQQILDLLER